MKLFIQQANKSSLKLQNLETLSSMSKDEMMDWSGGYGKTTCCENKGKVFGHHQHTKTYEHMGPYGMVTTTVTECCTVPWHVIRPMIDPAPNPPHWLRLIENGKEKNHHSCRGNHNHH